MSYITPNVLRKKYQGIEIYNLRDIEFFNRNIIIDSVFDYEMCISIASQIRYLEKQNPNQEIVLRITSPGGLVSAGFLVADSIKICKAPITTVALGNVASMGSLIFSLGDRRLIYPSSTVMIHDPIISEGIRGSSALEIAKHAKEMMKIRKKIANILAVRCQRSLNEIYEATVNETVFSAKEAVAFGIADEITNELI